MYIYIYTHTHWNRCISWSRNILLNRWSLIIVIQCATTRADAVVESSPIGVLLAWRTITIYLDVMCWFKAPSKYMCTHHNVQLSRTYRDLGHENIRSTYSRTCVCGVYVCVCVNCPDGIVNGNRAINQPDLAVDHFKKSIRFSRNATNISDSALIHP